jgi:hypothetical protein
VAEWTELWRVGMNLGLGSKLSKKSIHWLNSLSWNAEDSAWTWSFDLNPEGQSYLATRACKKEVGQGSGRWEIMHFI